MRLVYQLLILLLTTIIQSVDAQELDRMNKAQLRAEVLVTYARFDSLRLVNISLEGSKNNLSDKLTLLEKSILKKEEEVSGLRDIVEKRNIDLARTLSKNEELVLNLEKLSNSWLTEKKVLLLHMRKNY